MSDSSNHDLDLWRALYDAALTPGASGVLHVDPPFEGGPYELVVHGVDDILAFGVLEAVRIEGDLLRLHTSEGVFELPAQAPKLRRRDGQLVDRSEILAARDAEAAELETSRVLQMVGLAYGEGRVDDAVALLQPLVDVGEQPAIVALGVIDRLEERSVHHPGLARAAEQGNDLALVAMRARDPEALRHALLAFCLE